MTEEKVYICTMDGIPPDSEKGGGTYAGGCAGGNASCALSCAERQAMTSACARILSERYLFDFLLLSTMLEMMVFPSVPFLFSNLMIPLVKRVLK